MPKPVSATARKCSTDSRLPRSCPCRSPSPHSTVSMRCSAVIFRMRSRPAVTFALRRGKARRDSMIVGPGDRKSPGLTPKQFLAGRLEDRPEVVALLVGFAAGLALNPFQHLVQIAEKRVYGN